MAQVDQNNPNDPNNPNNPNNPQNQDGQEVSAPATSGGGGAVTSTGSGNVAGSVTGTGSPSQPFQNISSYLAANEPQSKKLASDVAGTVTNPINQAQQGITDAAGQFTQSVNAGYTPKNEQLISGVANNAAAVANDPNNVEAFKAQLNNRYAGPSDFTQWQGYGDLQSKIAAAQQQAANTGNEAGIQTLLKAVEGPTTAGINKLDSLLLSTNPENYKTIKEAGAGAANLAPALSSATGMQNDLAAKAAKEAADISAAARASLDTGRTNLSTNLADRQSTVEGLVNQYNKSVGIVNPVTQAIAANITDYLNKNPNLSMSSIQDILAPLMNLQNIDMPDVSTYASPEDYAQLAALGLLGDTNLNGLPINASQKDLAQTFNIPTQLQDAIGKAPGVQQSLSDALNSLGSQITGAYDPYEKLLNKEMVRAGLRTELDKINLQISSLGRGVMPNDPKKLALEAQKADVMKRAGEAGVGDRLYGSYWDDLGNMAKSLQWLAPASQGYNDLIAAVNAELGKLGEVGAPTLSYAPQNVESKSASPMIAPETIEKAGNITSTAIGAGIPAATQAGLLAASSIVPTTASALAAAPAGTVAGQVLPGATGLTGVQAMGPAAVAAYGTSNIAQNAAKNPIQSGIATLANTGLSLATLSLPPKIFDSIGKNITNVVNSVKKFFKKLF